MKLKEIAEKTELILFKERIQKADKPTLLRQMSQYKDIGNLLSTKAPNLNELYRNLIEEIIPDDYSDKTLCDIILDSLGYKTPWNPYFSMCGEKINGFFAYSVSFRIVTNIKMFSFELGNSLTLLRDLNCLVLSLKEKYKWIHWEAFKRNEIGNKIYQKAIERHNGISIESDKDSETKVHYFVPGTETLPKDILKALDEMEYEEGINEG